MSAPAPLRLAAGLAVTAAEEAFRLPYRVGRIPSRLLAVPGDIRRGGERAAERAAGRALTGAVRLQQSLNGVMAKGEVALEEFAAPPAPETAEWATFDDDVAAESPADVAARVGYDGLDADDLEDLLDELPAADAAALAEHEAAGEARPAFLTLLANAADGRA
ncbi:hypothetical protein [Corynebacterium sp. 335C]